MKRPGVYVHGPLSDLISVDAEAETIIAHTLDPTPSAPPDVSTRGITRLTPERVRTLKQEGKTVRLVSRAKRANGGLSLRVRAEVLDQTDILPCVHGTSNVLLLHTDLMGTIGTVSISPAVEQTAYGVFIDLVDVWRAVRP